MAMKPCRLGSVFLVTIILGCAGPALRSQSPEEDFELAVESNTRLVGDIAKPYGNTYVKIESVALVTGLAGTGEDPAPSPQRAALLNELQVRGVQNPNALLASPTTAIVLVRGFLPPGVQKGDKFDLEVQIPSRSETSNLRSGWVMETRLAELAVLGNQIRDGHIMAIGEGPILVDPSADGEKDRALLTRGRVLRGGQAVKSRSLGLVIKNEDKSVRISSQIGEAINKRFHTFSQGIKQGVAKPKTDEFVELAVHPRYKDNIARYLRVVRSVAIREAPAETATRLEQLERQLLDPVTASTAALRLEAIGTEAVKVLSKGLESKDPEVRFYSAEALAYLDQSNAAGPLAEAAKNEPAFRAYALAALGAMDDVSAFDELRSLLDVASVETRYGAFRSMWAMNPNEPLVRGENLGGQFSYHLLTSSGPPLIHVTRSFRAEIVIFGHDQHFTPPLVLDAGKSIMVNAAAGSDKVTISRFAVGEPDQKRVVSTKIDEVIRAIVELGGTYPDVVQALQQAKASQSLPGRVEVDAIPDNSRPYERKEVEFAEEELHEDSPAEDSAADEPIEVASPLPELFGKGGGKAR
jgi:flagellar basal body P-ring protein FlgI